MIFLSLLGRTGLTEGALPSSFQDQTQLCPP